jgi:hypothetical protein
MGTSQSIHNDTPHTVEVWLRAVGKDAPQKRVNVQSILPNATKLERFEQGVHLDVCVKYNKDEYEQRTTCKTQQELGKKVMYQVSSIVDGGRTVDTEFAATPQTVIHTPAPPHHEDHSQLRPAPSTSLRAAVRPGNTGSAAVPAQKVFHGGHDEQSSIQAWIQRQMGPADASLQMVTSDAGCIGYLIPVLFVLAAFTLALMKFRKFQRTRTVHGLRRPLQ